DGATAARAFERFYRADPGRARDRGGSGLGLAIAQAVARAHGGRATLDSIVGAGTTVRVDVPLVADPRVRRTEQPAPSGE
ncbi:MAG TPA: ATP-binding protein, partial [Acidimicrobiales bacterium]|nr:ATP-binding protein [Acidimicrobiales bacterium]